MSVKSKRTKASSSTNPNRFVFIIVILLNIVLLTSAFLVYGRYTKAYQQSLYDENLGNVANLNHSAAMNATALFESWDIKLDDVARYIGQTGMTYREALQMISDSNSNPNRYFELIGSDYTGFVAKEDAEGNFPPVSYVSGSYQTLHRALDDTEDDDFGDICFTPEFTDNGETAAKFFSVYRHIMLKNEQGEDELYTLLLATRAKDVLAVFNDQQSFEGQSTVLIDAKGDYIVSNRDFKSNNFFQYLYVYNDLTMDEKNQIQADMTIKGSGTLFYKNASSVVEDCVFRYERIATNGWYSVTCVPVSSFRTPTLKNNYIVHSVFMLVLLLLLDVSWFWLMNRRLRISIIREKEASAAKGNFMSRMSHEIRTPLNAVIGYNTIARSEMTEAKNDAERKRAEMKVMDCLTKSSIASKHLLTIINDVLDMSAIESGRIKVAQERFDFKTLITSLTTVFYSQAKNKEVNLEVVFDSLIEEWLIGDQVRTNQILTNLLSNAVKFTPEGGTVKLTVSQTNVTDKTVQLHFEVADTGIGMTEEYLTHIWTPFEQADSSISRRFGGTGLGLSITKNLVDLMKGKIEVESAPGNGTTFRVDLSFGRTEQPDENTIYHFESVNALVVDDDVYTCDYIKQLFRRCGARCTSVTSGELGVEAFASANQTDTPYTMCLVDWKMPEMDGIETIRRIKQLSGDKLPIVVITAYDFSEISENLASIGVNMFLSKPLFQSTLFDTLANICGKTPQKEIKKNNQFDFAGARVLLAEDNAMNMEIAKRILESVNVQVDCANNGEEAVLTFEAAPVGTYAAILMDVHMPVMNGHQATQAIRASAHTDAKTIPIIAMTADAFAENVSEALAAGMNEHISKPIDVQVLFTTLQKYIK